jgi:hypothetical protein
VLVGAAFFWFFSWPFKKRTPPRWLPFQNQRAEGTKKVFLYFSWRTWDKTRRLLAFEA